MHRRMTPDERRRFRRAHSGFKERRIVSEMPKEGDMAFKIGGEYSFIISRPPTRAVKKGFAFRDAVIYLKRDVIFVGPPDGRESISWRNYSIVRGQEVRVRIYNAKVREPREMGGVEYFGRLVQ